MGPRLAQNQMFLGSQAYPTKSNNLVEIMNSKMFEPDPFKPKNTRNCNCDRKKKMNEDKETVGAIAKSSPNKPPPDELDSVEKEVPDRDNEKTEPDSRESISEDSGTSSGIKNQIKKAMPNHT